MQQPARNLVMLKRLISRLRREAFLPTPLGMVVGSQYILRDGLYKSILSFAPGVEGNVLDFGCGSKPYESIFTNATSYVGVDIEVSGHVHQNSKVDIFYDGKKLPFPDDHFDAVVSFEVFEHVFNLEEVLREIRRVLKPDGKLLVTMPFAWHEHEAPYDFARYTSYGIRHVLQNGGFEVLEVKKTTTSVLAICQMFIAYLAEYVRPRNKVLAKVFQLVLLFPLTALSLLLNRMLPRRYEYFCNSVVFARKGSA